MLVVTRRQAVLGVGMIVAAASVIWSVDRAATYIVAAPSAPVAPPTPDMQQKGQQPRPPPHQQDGAEGLRDGDGRNSSSSSRGTGIVTLKFMGRLGNNLFEYATARVLADRLGWALSLQTAPGNAKKYGTLLRPRGMACFPGVRPLGPPASSPAMAQLEAPRFRGFWRELKDTTPRAIVMKDWFQQYKPFAADSGRLRQVMALDPTCCGPTAPGPNDLVIHHRNYKGELTDVQYAKLHFKDLKYEFYDAVLRDATAVETVWIVGEFGPDDPLVARLRQEHPNVRKADNVVDQFRAFCFLSRARRLVMAHSTFSWWVAFLGNATEVHFPLTPNGGGVTGRNLVVTGDPRYVYRDDNGRIVSP